MFEKGKSWAEAISSGSGRYMTLDGQAWDGDDDTIYMLRGSERPDPEAKVEAFPQKLTNARVVELLREHGYVESN